MLCLSLLTPSRSTNRDKDFLINSVSPHSHLDQGYGYGVIDFMVEDLSKVCKNVLYLW